MKFTVSRDSLLKPLNLVAGVVERRQTLPILSNVLLSVEGQNLSLTGTDLEVELIGQVPLSAPADGGDITVPARKLADICKSLPDGSEIEFSFEEERVALRSGRSRFSLSTLPASDFPNVEEGPGAMEFTLQQADLRRLIESTAFSMAQQDVRYYLNGMLFELAQTHLRAVATDGHRLAMCTLEQAFDTDQTLQVILPRKGVLELQRLLQEDEETVSMVLGSNHLRASTSTFTFTSKLVDGKFPDYDRVVPRNATRAVLASRGELKDALSRAAILSNEKYRGVRLLLTEGSLQILANNPEQEEAEETVTVDYQGDGLEIGFNVSYLVDVLNALGSSQVKVGLGDPSSSALLEEPDGGDALYVVMPMRL